MKLIALRSQMNLIILLFLIFNNPIEAGFIRGAWNMVGNVFKGAAWTIEKGFESVANLVMPEPEPEPTVYDALLQDPPEPSIPWAQRVPPSMRGPPAAGVPYYASPHHHLQHHGPYHKNLGYHWNNLITEAEAQNKFHNTQQQNYYPPANSNIQQQNYYPRPTYSKNQPPNYGSTNSNSNTNYQNRYPPTGQNTQLSRDRGEIALQINKIIEELNINYGNSNHSYSDEVYVIVRKIYDLLYKPGFDLKNEFFKRVLDDYIREIALVYNKELNTIKVGGNSGKNNEKNNSDNSSSGINVENAQLPKNESKAPAVISHMEEFDELIFMLEDMETSDVNLIFEYMNAFCSKYYKSRNGQYYYTVNTEVFNMGEFIKSEFFEFPGDPSIRESPGNPSTLELVKYIEDIEKAFSNLPPEEFPQNGELRNAIGDITNIGKELVHPSPSNDGKSFSNSRNIDIDQDLSNLLSLDFDIEDFIILTATAGSLALTTLNSQNKADESGTNNGSPSWLAPFFNFGQSSDKSLKSLPHQI